MGGMCYIIWGALLAAMGVGGFLLWAGLCFAGVFAFRPKGKRAAALLIALACYLPLCLATAGLVYVASRPDTDDIFEMAFDIPPPAGVTIHEAEIDGGCDWQDSKIRFTASQANIQAITAYGMVIDPNYAKPGESIKTSQGSVPLSQCEIYTGPSPDRRFSSADQAVLIYDPVSGQAEYTYQGID